MEVPWKDLAFEIHREAMSIWVRMVTIRSYSRVCR